MFLVALHFCFRKKALKVLHFRIFLSQKAPMSRKYVSEPGMTISNSLEKLQSFWSQSTVVTLEK